MHERWDQHGIGIRCKSEISSLELVDQLSYAEASVINERIFGLFLIILVLKTNSGIVLMK